MKFSFSLISILLVFQINVFSQNDPLGSLKELLNNTPNDTAQIRLLNEIAEFSEDSAIFSYASKALNHLRQFDESFRRKNKYFFNSQLASSYYWVSIYYNQQEQKDSGRKYLDLSLKSALEINDPRFISLVYNDFGVLAIHKGPDSSIYWMNKSLPLARLAGDSDLIGTIHNNLGHLYRVKGDYLTAVDHLFIAIKIDEQLGNIEDVGLEYNNIGTIFFDLDMLDEALQNHRKAYAIAFEAGDEKALGIRLNNIGSDHENAHRLDSALIYYQRSLLLRQKLKLNWAIGESFGNIASVLKKKGQYAEAKDYLYKSIHFNQIDGDSFRIAASQLSLGSVYLILKAQDSAEWYLLTAYKYMKKNAGPQDVRDASWFLSQLYGQRKDFQKAYMYTQEYVKARDSIENQSIKKNALSKQFEFEYTKKEAIAKAEQEKKDAVSALELRNQKLVRNVFIGALCIAIFISILLFNRYRLKQKTSLQLEEKNVLIEKEKQRAEQSEKFKSQFLANMSHEIRTPMNAVMGFTNLLFDEENESKRLQYLTAIKKSSENLLVVINDVLDLTKLEAGKMGLEKIPFHIREVLNFIYESFQLRSEEKRLKLVLSITDEVPAVVIGDPSRLTQVLMNLVGNAVKFTAGGSVVLKIETTINEPAEKNNVFPVSRLRFSVSDTGIGIPEEKLSNIFETFAQAHASDNRKYGGTGLGLTISKNLIELMDGKLEVKSTPGEGSEFSFTISVEIATEEQLIQHQKKELVFEEDLGEELAGIKIFLAEDNEYNQLLVVDTLRKFIPDVQIEVVKNGRELIDILKKHPLISNSQWVPDSRTVEIILMDVQMPEMDGYETTIYIRNNFLAPVKDIPIIALTASVLRTDIDKCLQAGMNGYVSKPFKEKELLVEIAKLTGKVITANAQNIIKEKAAVRLENNGSLISLQHLHKITEGDPQRLKKYLSLFLDQISKHINSIEQAQNIQDWSTIRSAAHFLKPQLISLELKDAIALAESIESDSIEKKQLLYEARRFVEICQIAVEEIKVELQSIKDHE